MKGRRRTIPKRLPTPTPANAAEREYYKHLRMYAAAFENLLTRGVNELLPGLRAAAAADLPPELQGASRSDAFRMDTNIEELLRKLLESVQDDLYALFPDTLLMRWAQSMVGHVNRIATVNFVKTAKAAELDVEPFMRDGKLNPFFQNVIEENVGLIRSISQSDLPSFKNKLVMAVTQDLPSDQLREMISGYVKTIPGRAKLIAVDQVNKLNGAIDEFRQKQIGGSRYRWRTAKDERVAGNPRGKYPNAKPSHWAREGVVFRWDNPPKGGHPKRRVRCRCWAEMVLEDVIE